MNNIKNNLFETGLIETLSVVFKYIDDEDIIADTSLYLPIPEGSIEGMAQSIAEYLDSLGKEKLLFLTPEIAVIEAVANCKNIKEIIICLPTETTNDVRECIESNMPSAKQISFIKSTETPAHSDFKVENSAIVCFGFWEGERAIVLNNNYKMMQMYKDFYGDKILISCGNGACGARPIGWTPINTYDFFNKIA